MTNAWSNLRSTSWAWTVLLLFVLALGVRVLHAIGHVFDAPCAATASALHTDAHADDMGPGPSWCDTAEEDDACALCGVGPVPTADTSVEGPRGCTGDAPQQLLGVPHVTPQQLALRAWSSRAPPRS